MMGKNLGLLRVELEQHVRSRTGRNLRDLDIELSTESVTLHGLAPTFYVKQLAQHCIQELLPNIDLRNLIKVA
jgi:hypothetical protein